MVSSVCLYVLLFSSFFFKQKTTYEMRIIDWSSDVCSSDLLARRARCGLRQLGVLQEAVDQRRELAIDHVISALRELRGIGPLGIAQRVEAGGRDQRRRHLARRVEQRRHFGLRQILIGEDDGKDIVGEDRKSKRMNTKKYRG